MYSIKFVFTLTLSLCVQIIFGVPEARAQVTSPFGSGTCTYPNPTPTKEPIHIYLQKDLGQRISSCLVTSPNLTDYQAKTVVLAGFETWNQESRSRPFMYVGDLDGTFPGGAGPGAISCSNFVRTPAVFVSAQLGCAQDAFGKCREGLWALANNSFCADVATITIFMDDNEIGNSACDPSDAGILELLVNKPGGSDLFDLRSIITHEAGHILGLNHPSDPNVFTLNPTLEDYLNNPNNPNVPFPNGNSFIGNSVMDIGDRHLFPWDVDCTDDASAGGPREVKYYWKSVEGSGLWSPSISGQSNSTSTSKGISSGNYFWNTLGSGSPSYVVYEELNLGIYIDTLDNFSPLTGFTQNEIKNLYSAPHLFSPIEKFGKNNYQRMNYNRKAMSYISDYTEFYPPRVQYKRSEDYIQSSAISGSYSEQTGTSSSPIHSHLPMVSAWDEASQVTVFAYVRTDPLHDGDIVVLPGFDGSSNVLLNEGHVLSQWVSAPSTGNPDFSYQMKTDAPVGIACSPDKNKYIFNCIITWQDAGTPDGRILYTYFRTDETFPGSGEYNISWEYGPAAVRSNASTVAGVSAAFFGDKFWTAWKTYEYSLPEIAWSSNKPNDPSPEFSWESPQIMSHHKSVVDTPTWLYQPNSTDPKTKHILIWTEYDYGL